MKNNKTRQQRVLHLHGKSQGRRAQLVVAGISVALAGMLLLHAGSAATYAVDSESESGTLAGNAVKLAGSGATGASGGAAVKFDAAASLPAPYFARAVTGGNSIAVVWRASPSTAVTKYEVYRNDSLVATTTVGTGTTLTEKEARTYIDKNVTRGTSYTYKVRALAANGAASSFTPAGTVTHPTSTTPIPTITFNTSAGGSEHTEFLNNYIKPYIETWFPKISDAIAYPDYTPHTTINIVGDPSITDAGDALWQSDRIRFNPSWLTSNWQTGAETTFLHESTHLIGQRHNSDNTPMWLREGLGEWPEHWLTLTRSYMPPPNATLAMGYADSAAALQLMRFKYDQSIIRKLVQASRNGTYAPSIVSSATGGKTPEQVFAEMKALYLGPVGQLKHASGLCAEIPGAATANGTNLKLATCTSSGAQQWQRVYSYVEMEGGTANKSIFRLANPGTADEGKCAIADNATNPARISSWHCRPESTGSVYLFTAGASNSLRRFSNGQCVATADATAAVGGLLGMAVCDGSARQGWTIP